MLVRLLLAAALLLSAPAARAQTQATQPTAGQIAQARERADELIAAADAAGVFANKTDSEVAQVEHIPSGMVCLLGDDPATRLHIFPTMSSGIPRGDDVACITREGDIDISVYATRYPGGMDTRSIVTNAVGGIRQRWPDAVPYDGQIATASMEGVAAPETAAFKLDINGSQMLTMVIGSQMDDWSIKVRITGPYDEAAAVSLRGAIGMAFVQMNMND